MSIHRRGAALLSVAAALAIVTAAGSPAVATPATSTHGGTDSTRGASSSGSTWLIAADDTADAVYVVDPRSGTITGTLHGVELGTHAGTLQLGNGRVAFMDESKPQLDVVDITTGGRPVIREHVTIPSIVDKWERAGWLATDPSHRYVAVGSDFDGSTTQQVTVVDTRTGGAHTITLPVSSVSTPSGTSTEEMEVFLVGSPLRLVVTAGGHLDAYALAPILRGVQHPVAFAQAPLSAYPHGPVVNASGTVIGSDVAVGVQTVQVTRDGFATAGFTSYPKPSIESYRPVMAPDGTTAVGTQAGATTAGTTWDRTPVTLTTTSTGNEHITSVDLGVGAFSRTAATTQYAAVAVTGATGDRVAFVARDARTGFFNGAVRSTALAGLANEPTPGSGTAAATTRFLAASPEGSTVFVTRAGEGQVTELAVSGRNASTVRTARTIQLPSALSDGGYLAVVSTTTRPYDLIGR
ncbi:hypothetical protein DEI92_15305 [Curtobacterium sp. MCBD17_034]|uniref:hypothetical protein n=1 Tax=unclassified Curtobacterium TaxID=257496 RepID=UPI000DA96A7B|nr:MULTISPECIES: hypothetical protein [unclassified Curtobacterium]PZF56166.1 hypothetical protein DEI92_15305 [Curtobacterium sp. MCBD17_034]PZM32969.1 hypothetical protein DEI90_15285 [Curtobacterium sp. MCBD17_031]